MPVALRVLTEQLAALGVLTPSESATASRVPSDAAAETPEALLDRLVMTDRLTPYQRRELLAGRGPQLMLGNYLIRDCLGRGGMGVVYRAVHRRMKRTVALKILSPEVTRSAEAVQRFQREVEAVARLEHPHVVTAYDADEARGTHFFVMQFVDGADLATVVKQRGPLSVRQALTCLLHAARGLEYAHRRGIVHRDIKPSNLLLDVEGVVRVLDLGLARIDDQQQPLSQLTETGAVMGTVDYMAPEQALNTRSADARSDIYSLGITLWYLLLGRPAYTGTSLMARLLAHREGPIPSLSAARPDVPDAVETLFRSMVAKRPEDRPASMTVVIIEIERLLEQMPFPPEDHTAHSIADASRSERPSSIGSTGSAVAAVATPEPTAEFPSTVTRPLEAIVEGTVADMGAVSESGATRTTPGPMGTSGPRGDLAALMADYQSWRPALVGEVDAPPVGLGVSVPQSPLNSDPTESPAPADGPEPTLFVASMAPADLSGITAGTSAHGPGRPASKEPARSQHSGSPAAKHSAARENNLARGKGLARNPAMLAVSAAIVLMIGLSLLTQGDGNGRFGELLGLPQAASDRPASNNPSLDRQASDQGTIDKPENPPPAPPQPLQFTDQWSVPKNLGRTINTVDRDLNPTLTADERTLIFVRGREDLWISERPDRHVDFGPARKLPGPVGERPWRVGHTITGDGLTFVGVIGIGSGGTGHVWQSRRTSRDVEFPEPTLLPGPINEVSYASNPVLSSDGLWLIVTGKAAPGRQGDLVVYRRDDLESPFAASDSFGTELNTAAWDMAGFLSHDQRAFLRVEAIDKLWVPSLHLRSSPDVPFGPGVRCEQEPLREIHGRGWISPDNNRIYFHQRDLPGGSGELDLWMIERVKPGP